MPGTRVQGKKSDCDKKDVYLRLWRGRQKIPVLLGCKSAANRNLGEVAWKEKTTYTTLIEESNLEDLVMTNMVKDMLG